MGSKAHLNQVIASHLVEIRAEEKPDREIFVFERGEHGEDVLTYKDLHENSNKMARLLLDNGIRKGDTFAVFMRNYPEFVYSILAGTTIGAIMVPDRSPIRGDRLRFLLEQLAAPRRSSRRANAWSSSKRWSRDLTQSEVHHHCLPAGPGRAGFIGISMRSTRTLEKDSWRDRGPADHGCAASHADHLHFRDHGRPQRGDDSQQPDWAVQHPEQTVLEVQERATVLYNGLSLTHGNAQAVTLFPALNHGHQGGFQPALHQEPDLGHLPEIRVHLLFTPRRHDGRHLQRAGETGRCATIRSGWCISAGTPLPIWEAFEKRFNVKILEWYGSVEGGFAFKPIGQGPIGSFGKPVPGVMEFKVVDEDDKEVPAGQTGELISRMVQRRDEGGLPGPARCLGGKDEGRLASLRRHGAQGRAGLVFLRFPKGHRTPPRRRLHPAGLRGDGPRKTPSVSEVCVYGIPAASGAPGESDLVAALAPFRRHVDRSGLRL